jgi:hypothetical protein
MKIIARFFYLLLLVAATVCCAADWNGATVPPYPEGWEDVSGMCLADPSDASQECAYSLQIMATSRQRVLLFERAAPSLEPQHARWRILDHIGNAGHADQEFILGACERFGKLDPTIVTIVKLEHVEWYRVMSAYRVNFKTAKIEKIPTRGVRCFNAGWDA